MGKANIMTDLAMRLRTDTADLNKGLARSKKSLNTFKKDTKQASGQIKGIFSSLQGEAAAGFSKFGAGFQAMNGALKGSIRLTKGLMGGMKGLKLAVISTGIGAIFVAIGVVILAVNSYLKGTVDGARKLATVTGFLKGLMTGLKEILINVGRFLVKMWEDPKQAIADLWASIKQNLVNRFQGLIKVFNAGFRAINLGAKGLAASIAGIFNKEKKAEAEEYFKLMAGELVNVAKASAQLATGLDVEKLIDKARGAAKKLNEVAQEGANIEVERFDLFRKNTAFLITEAEMKRKIAELTEQSSDKELEGQKRLEATNSALAKSEVLYNNRISLISKEIELKEREMEMGSNTKEDERALAELKVVRINLQKEALDKERELKNRREEINASIAMDKVKKEREAQIKIDKIRKEADAEEKKRIDSQESYRKQILGQSLEGQLTLLEAEFDAKMILENEYKSEKLRILDELAKREDDAHKKRVAQVQSERDARFQAVNNWLEVSALGAEVVGSIFDAQMKKELAAAGDNEEEKERIRLKFARKQKALAIIQALINTAQGITKGFADGGVLGFLTSGLIAAAGAAQIASIKSTPLAKGGVAYSPVNALVGEYKGAANNPEIIAPLSKLQDIIGGGFGGQFIARIGADEIYFMLEEYKRKKNNSYGS